MINTLKDFTPAAVIAAGSGTIGVATEAITGLPVGVSVTIILALIGGFFWIVRFSVSQGRWQQKVDDDIAQISRDLRWVLDNNATISDNQKAAQEQRNESPIIPTRHTIKQIGHVGV